MLSLCIVSIVYRAYRLWITPRNLSMRPSLSITLLRQYVNVHTITSSRLLPVNDSYIQSFGSKVWNANLALKRYRIYDDFSSIRLLDCICTIHLLVLQYAFIFKNCIETEYILFSWLLHLSCEYECCKSWTKLYVYKNMHIYNYIWKLQSHERIIIVIL